MMPQLNSLSTHLPMPPVARTANSAAPTAEDFTDLPQQMLQAPRWLVWKSTPNSYPDKKPRKIPVYTNGQQRGKGTTLDSPEDVAALATFEDALCAMQSGDYTGLGFALGPDGTGNFWQGIDLDNLSGRPELGYIADNLPGYTESSPSGNGVHAIGYGRPFTGMGSNITGIEAYSAGRYFTVTADGAGIHPITCLADFVEQQLRPIHGTRDEPQSVAGATTSFDQVSPKTVTELRSALLHMRADERDVWIRMGHALKKLGNVGRGLWLEWSATSEKFDSSDAAQTWEGFKPHHTNYQAVFAESQRQGWVNPLSNGATGGARSEVSGLGVTSPFQTQQSTTGAESDTSVNLEDCIVDLDEVVSADSVHPHVIEMLVPQGEVTLLAGHGAAGKSYIALLACILVALGKDVGKLSTRRSRVLFFSAEDDKAEMQRRVAKICRSLSVNQADLKGWLFLMDVSEMDPTLFRVNGKGESTQTPRLGSLATYVQAHDIGLTVIDNASDVFDGNEIVRAQVRAFIRSLRTRLARPDRAVILLAHVSKAAAHNKKGALATDEDYSGSTAWHNSVRSRLSLDTDDKGMSTLKHLKANKGPKAETIQLEWHEGCPTVEGTHEIPGAGLFAAMRNSAEKEQDEAYKSTIIKIIWDFDRRGERVTTSMQGSVTVFKALSTSAELPKGITSERLNRLMRDLEREGRVYRSKRYTTGRKWVDCFTCSKAVVESALNPDTEHSSRSLNLPGAAH